MPQVRGRLDDGGQDNQTRSRYGPRAGPLIGVRGAFRLSRTVASSTSIERAVREGKSKGEHQTGFPASCGSSVQWLPAEQSQVDARCLEDLGRSIRIDPALCRNAHTPHPTQKGDQLVIDAGKHVHRLVLERCEIPFDRAHARRLEVEEQQAMIGCQPVPLVWAPMERSVHGRDGREFGLHLVQDALEEPTIGTREGRRAVRLEEPSGIFQLEGEGGREPGKSLRSS